MFFSKLNPGGQLSDVSKKIQKELHKSAQRQNGITYQKWQPTKKEDDSDDQNNTYLPSDEQLNEILGLSDDELKKLFSYQGSDNLIQSKLLKFIKEPKVINTMSQQQIKQKQSEQLPSEQPQKREIVKIDWFKDYIQQTDQDEFKAKALEILLKKMADAEQKAGYFFTDEIYELRYDRYQSMLKDDDIRDKITENLIDKYPQFKNQQKQISAQIQKADKDLFIKLRDGNFTLDQLKARMAERRNNVKYVVLDDLLEMLGPNFQQIYERSLKQQSKVQNQQKLIKKQRKPKNTQCFEAVSRTKGMKHQNYQTMPNSFAIDFKQPENCKKEERVILKPKYKLAQSVPKLKVNYQELAQKRRENMMDPEKQKKMLNVERLKKNLAKKLILHRQLEISQMPFDSSKVAFHDMMDMFFRQSDLRNKLLSPENQPKKDQLNKTVDSNQEIQKNQGRMSDYLQAYEQKKIEQKKRRMKILFLKRLENDGVRIIMSQQDRELLKNFGNLTKENDESEINQAMDADFQDCKLSENEIKNQTNIAKKKNISIDEQDPESQIEQLQINKLKYKCAQTKAVQKIDDNEQYQNGTFQVKEKLFKTRDNKDIEIISTIKFDEFQKQKDENYFCKNDVFSQNNSTHYIKIQNQSNTISFNQNIQNYYQNRNDENQNMQRSLSSPNINQRQVRNNPILWKTSTNTNSQAEGINIKPQLTSTNQSRNVVSNYKSHALGHFPQAKDAFSATIGESDEQTIRNQIQYQYIENSNFQIQNQKSLQVTQFLKNEGHHIFSKNSLLNTQNMEQNIDVEIKAPSIENLFTDQNERNIIIQQQQKMRGQTVLTKSSYLQDAIHSPINSLTFHQNQNISSQNQQLNNQKENENNQINEYLQDLKSEQVKKLISKPENTNSNKEIKTLDQILFLNYDQTENIEDSQNREHTMQPIGAVQLNKQIAENQENPIKKQKIHLNAQKTKNTSPQTQNERPHSKQNNIIDISKATSIFQAHQTSEKISVMSNQYKKSLIPDFKDQIKIKQHDRNLQNYNKTQDHGFNKNFQEFTLQNNYNEAPYSQRKFENSQTFEQQDLRRLSLQNEQNIKQLQENLSKGQIKNQIIISETRLKYKTSQNISGEGNKNSQLSNNRLSNENNLNKTFQNNYVITKDLKNFANNLGIPIFKRPQIIENSLDLKSPVSNQEIQNLKTQKSQQKTIIQNVQTQSTNGIKQNDDQEDGVLIDNAVEQYRNTIGNKSSVNNYPDQNYPDQKNSHFIQIKRVLNSGKQRNSSESNYSRLQFQKGPINPKYLIEQNNNQFKIQVPPINDHRYNITNQEQQIQKNFGQQIKKKGQNFQFSKFKEVQSQNRQQKNTQNGLLTSDKNLVKNKLIQSDFNPVQDRLKTALLNQRQKKDNFNMQLQQKNIVQNIDLLSNNEAFLTLDKEMAELNLRSLQLDTLQYQLMKEQCKVNNDYKSMAALARLQQKNQYDSIKTLHHHDIIKQSLDRSQEQQILRNALNQQQMQDQYQSKQSGIDYQSQNIQQFPQQNIELDQNYLMIAQSAQNTLTGFNKNQLNIDNNYKNQTTSFDNFRVSRVNLLQKYNTNKQDEQSQKNMNTSSSRVIGFNNVKINQGKNIKINENLDLQKQEATSYGKKFELKKFGNIENNLISLQNDSKNRIGFLKSAGGNRNQSRFQKDLQLNQNIKTAQKNTPTKDKFNIYEKNSQKTLETGENSKSFYMRMSSINNNQQIFKQSSERKIKKY